MKNIYVLAPNDRFNYGDLLFPYIIKHYFHDSCDKMIFCSTTKSDLSDFGGIPTNAFNILYDVDSKDSNYLIIAGGDSLCIEWPLILSFIDSSFSRIDYFVRIHFLNRLVKNYFLRNKYHVRTAYPFTLGKSELDNFKGIYYNSLGGSYLNHHLELLEDKSTLDILGSADYLSVRDRKTVELLSQHNINSRLVPDSAILMSDVFTDSFLKSNISKNLISRSSRYIFFQINLANYINKEEVYAHMLRKIQTSTGVNIVLCPIATAFGHSDQEALSKIMTSLSSNSSFNLISNPSIWDIMWLIKQSCLYVGTSLHGTITAMSFGVPFAVHGPEKLKFYLDSWGGSQFFSSNTSDLHKTILSQLRRPIKFDVTMQKHSVLNSFQIMKELISKAESL